MYLISNSDLDYIKRYIGLMIANTNTQETKSLRRLNDIRMAKLLLQKLEAKQPFPKDKLPETLKSFLK